MLGDGVRCAQQRACRTGAALAPARAWCHVTASNLEELLRLQERADIATTSRFEQWYGLVTEGRLTGWEEAPRAARRTLGATAPSRHTDR